MENDSSLSSSEEGSAMKREIYNCADHWLAVFHFLATYQLGIEIALLSQRFDCLVEEHFKTRYWAFDYIRIERKMDENGTEATHIENFCGKSMPIPATPLPRRITGFKCIVINCFDQSVVDFIRRFQHIFDTFGTKLYIASNRDSQMQFATRDIWPLLKSNICGIKFCPSSHIGFRQSHPSFLSDCYQSLRTVISFDHIPELPADASADATGNKALANWLLRSDDDGGTLPPKLARCKSYDKTHLSEQIVAFKQAFASASSPVNFIIGIGHSLPINEHIDLINVCTRERLVLKHFAGDEHNSLLIRCPIARDEHKWAQWEKEAIEWHFCDKWNRIIISSVQVRPVFDTFPVTHTPGCTGLPVSNDRKASAAAADAEGSFRLVLSGGTERYGESFFAEKMNLSVPPLRTKRKGPSASAAAALAFLSLATGRPVQPGVCVTGKVPKTGRISKIGQMKEKTIAAAEGRMAKIA
ncbi:hypothetical protein niasHT_031453 [Heterodera trifolii]|uniref:Lon proteolytic domain-containing protein n=1 Tax=Heterodera trifolii TaxID=157864 RepID=A0ABD2IWT8_9BILA